MRTQKEGGNVRWTTLSMDSCVDRWCNRSRGAAANQGQGQGQGRGGGGSLPRTQDRGHVSRHLQLIIHPLLGYRTTNNVPTLVFVPLPVALYLHLYMPYPST